MKVVIVVGARPNFMKAAPILAAIPRINHQLLVDQRRLDGVAVPLPITPILVHTGQHYDALMSDSFFADLNLPQPDIYLGVGSGSHAVQTAVVMTRFEEVLSNQRPDIVVVVGDVNSTVACSLVTAKMFFEHPTDRPLLAHVEAGLRSFDRTMPEECNRVVTDHLSDVLFVTERSGLENLFREGIGEERIFFVGNTMIDSLFAFQSKANESAILGRLGLCRVEQSDGCAKCIKPYALLTLHRPANVDNVDAFSEILEGLRDLAGAWSIIFPAHPRTQQRIQQNHLESCFDYVRQCSCGTDGDSTGIKVIEPLSYIDFLCLMKHAALVITDSGGIQEETTCLGVPCVTVRENTERPVTVCSGTNVLAGVRREGIQKAIQQQLARRHAVCVPEKWDGHAGERIVQLLMSEYARRHSRVTPKQNGCPPTVALRQAQHHAGLQRRRTP